ncbi:PTS system mannose/fructose/N-acetylgalactosamine-transporter subunit IIB [Paratissierella segnis]|jgi:D-glucosaminate-specific PTS system IIB component|uniref:PTS sugar transporter subunit IIB n=1 Tax=Paratissierella segnis TaxID=2763679 RepID=A0A926EV68_9FIRM|nr:PTS sugar transporter subunit IIB [Paratissierella segnis]MBC8587059.1 PTS sugar transporter subunit IIB [Paratissierella segnis]
MADLSLVRIDSRLIHGQVLIMWTKMFPSKKIIIVDDEIANDKFMFQVFKLASPPKIKLEIFTTDDAAKKWKENKFGSLGPVFVLFKNVPVMYEAYKKGFEFDKLQLGGIGGGEGRIPVTGNINLDESDAKMLEELHKIGLDISFQVTPDTSKKDWSSIKDKFFPNV